MAHFYILQVQWLTHFLGKRKVAGSIPAGETGPLWACIRKGICVKLCQIKHAELLAVASPSGERVTASFFFSSNNPPAALYLHQCALLVKKSHLTWQFLGSRHCRPCGAASSRPHLSDGHRRHI